MLTVNRLLVLVTPCLWALGSTLPVVQQIAATFGFALITLLVGYWSLWYGRRLLFNGSVKPSGKAVLITGCDTGIGHLLAERLANDGFLVFAGCLDASGVGARNLQERSGIRVLQMDVTVEEEIEAAVEKVEKELDNLAATDKKRLAVQLRSLLATLRGVRASEARAWSSMLPINRLLVLVTPCLWALGSTVPVVQQISATFGFALLTLLVGYWSLWYGRRLLFNGSVKPNGKAVLITGCDTGFGHHLAEWLASDGFLVFAGCLDASGVGARALNERAGIHVLQMDVTVQEEVDAAVERVENELGNRVLWAVVCNAGVGSIGYINLQPMSRVRRVFDVNTFGVLSVATAFLPLVKKAGGRLVIVSSLLGRLQAPLCLAYSISKRAAISLADGLRRQYYATGVHVCTVEPTGYRTAITDRNLLEKEMDSDLKMLPPKIREGLDESARLPKRKIADALKPTAGERRPTLRQPLSVQHPKPHRSKLQDSSDEVLQRDKARSSGENGTSLLDVVELKTAVEHRGGESISEIREKLPEGEHFSPERNRRRTKSDRINFPAQKEVKGSRSMVHPEPLTFRRPSRVGAPSVVQNPPAIGHQQGDKDDTTDEEEMDKQCSSTDCLSAVKVIAAAMDVSADPCTNFYAFVCGHWSPLAPSTRKAFSRSVADRNVSYMASLRSDYVAAVNDSLWRVAAGSTPYDEQVNQMGQVYASCLAFFADRPLNLTTAWRAANILTALWLQAKTFQESFFLAVTHLLSFRLLSAVSVAYDGQFVEISPGTAIKGHVSAEFRHVIVTRAIKTLLDSKNHVSGGAHLQLNVSESPGNGSRSFEDVAEAILKIDDVIFNLVVRPAIAPIEVPLHKLDSSQWNWTAVLVAQASKELMALPLTARVTNLEGVRAILEALSSQKDMLVTKVYLMLVPLAEFFALEERVKVHRHLPDDDVRYEVCITALETMFGEVYRRWIVTEFVGWEAAADLKRMVSGVLTAANMQLEIAQGAVLDYAKMESASYPMRSECHGNKCLTTLVTAHDVKTEFRDNNMSQKIAGER
ncbi:hypothetical protein V5799_033406 [Amblyomma americanum]|uniref:Corticosteroid 11-beta-dehydrogenase n=1 Tax=Amblyomma americanum TaxID=6943 RepID=A0AAQ4DND7_AMBAM